jgi:hypothetical protein
MGREGKRKRKRKRKRERERKRKRKGMEVGKSWRRKGYDGKRWGSKEEGTTDEMREGNKKAGE